MRGKTSCDERGAPVSFSMASAKKMRQDMFETLTRPIENALKMANITLADVNFVEASGHGRPGSILWMDEILYHLEIPGTMIRPFYTNKQPWFESGAKWTSPIHSMFFFSPQSITYSCHCLPSLVGKCVGRPEPCGRIKRGHNKRSRQVESHACPGKMGRISWG